MVALVKDVTSESDFESLTSGSGRNCVIFFWADWHEPSKPGGQMSEVFEQLAKMHGASGDISFLKVEAEACPGLSERFSVSLVPSFLLMQGGKLVNTVQGADPPALLEAVQAFASSAAVQGGGGAAAASVSGPAANVSPSGANDDAAAAALLTSRLKRIVGAHQFMLMMKGSPKDPKCKFSRKVVATLHEGGVDFGSFDILKDSAVREGLKKYSDWPTYPQLYCNAQLVGGADIIAEMAEGGGDMRKKILEAVGADTAQVDGTAAAAAAAAAGGAAGGTAGGDTAGAAVSVEERCKALVSAAKVMLFMKGDPATPRCGFSRTIIEILQEEDIDFESFDILDDDDIRQGLKTYSNWPTYPQLYVNGELVGGLDILKEMREDGNLKEALGIA